MQDQTLTCKDCGKDFVWTASEQEFYASKGFSAPIRCADCRRKIKLEKQSGASRGPRQMYKITCANCGNEGEVPFEPRNPENVLCIDCFRKKQSGELDMPASKPATATESASTDEEPTANEEPAADAEKTDESTDAKPAEETE